MDEAMDASEVELEDEPSASDEPAKRKRGRPKGLPKTGGRPARPTTPAELRAYIIRELDKIEPLLDIAHGKQIRLSSTTGKSFLGYPSVADRLRAFELLMRKVLPDLAQTQLTGEDGGAVQIEDASTRDIARALMDLFRTVPLSDNPLKTEFGDLAVSGSPEAAGAVVDAAPVAYDRVAGRIPSDGELRQALKDRGLAHYPSRGEMPPERTAEESIAEQNAARSSGHAWPSTPAHRGMTPHVPRGERPPEGMSGLTRRGPFESGERIAVDGCSGWLEFHSMNGDGRARFYLVDKHGMRQGLILGQPEAEAALRTFERTGSIPR